MSNALALAAHWRANTPRLAGFAGLEAGLALIALLLFSNALLGPLLSSESDPEGNPALRLIWPPVYALTLILILLRPLDFWRTLLRAWPIVVIGALPMVSTVWSIDPAMSFRRGLAVFMTMMFGLWLASRYQWRDLVRLLGVSFFVLALGSIIASVVFPGFGVHQIIHPGAWKGLWWEKNTLGAVFAMASLSFACAGLTAPHRMERQIWILLVFLGVGLVLLSTSKTALLATLVCTLGPAAIWITRRGFGFATLAIGLGLIMVSLLAGILIIGPGVVLELLGRDATLTGRTDIWVILIEVIGDAPWTGYGYGAFWAVDNGPVFWVRQITQWPVPTAHNAWLETALALGVPVTLFVGLIVLTGLIKALMRLFKGDGVYWALPFLIAWLITSLSESNLMEPNGFMWVLLSMTLSKLYAWRG